MATGVLWGDGPSALLEEPGCRERWYIFTAGQEGAADPHSPFRNTNLRGRERQTERERGREIDREREGDRNRQRKREIDRKRER